MLSHSQQKLLRKLRSRKYRYLNKMFVAEGRKVVTELLQEGLTAEFLLATSDTFFDAPVVLMDKEGLKEWSSLQALDDVIGVFHFPDLTFEPSDLVLILDEIRDPGNLGTIIRSCDWFGVNTIFCSNGTVDGFNSKTVQSTMGSIGRVKLRSLSNEEILAFIEEKGYTLLSADMKGVPYNKVDASGKIALVMGSESHGPSEFWKSVSQAITINKGEDSKAESLNVGVAAAILIASLK